jgi:hypothetical protein
MVADERAAMKQRKEFWAVQEYNDRVYFSPTARRRFFTKRAAIRAEASALIARKYPKEPEERDEFGRTTYSGWHWRSDDRLCRLHDRLVRIITKLSKEWT